MTTSTDPLEPKMLSTAGLNTPLALLLSSLRPQLAQAVDQLAQLAQAGPLNTQQMAHYSELMTALHALTRGVELYTSAPERPQVQSIHAATSERWAAGEQSDALDDRYQDAPSPLYDRHGHDEQP